MKKILVWLCLLTMLFSETTTVFAAQSPVNYEAIGDTAEISERMKCFALVLASIDIDENGQAEYVGVFAVDTPFKVKFTVSLQRSKDGKTWSNMPGESVTKTFYDEGMWDTFGTSAPLSRAYNYRAKAVAIAYDSSGKALETITVYSLTQAYSLDVE